MISCSSNPKAEVTIISHQQNTGNMEGLYEDVNILFSIKNVGDCNLTDVNVYFEAETADGNTFEDKVTIMSIKKEEGLVDRCHLFVNGERYTSIKLLKIEY